jgi:hypothetical protein
MRCDRALTSTQQLSEHEVPPLLEAVLGHGETNADARRSRDGSASRAAIRESARARPGDSLQTSDVSDALTRDRRDGGIVVGRHHRASIFTATPASRVLSQQLLPTRNMTGVRATPSRFTEQRAAVHGTFEIVVPGSLKRCMVPSRPTVLEEHHAQSAHLSVRSCTDRDGM